jgi:hypothetical protein
LRDDGLVALVEYLEELFGEHDVGRDLARGVGLQPVLTLPQAAFRQQSRRDE